MQISLDALPDNTAEKTETQGPQPGRILTLEGLPDDTPAQLRQNYREFIDNPEQYVRARRAARLTGLPEPTALRNLPKVERLASEPDWHALADTAPRTASALTSIELFPIAHDDAPTIGGIEHSLKAIGAGAVQATLGLSEGIWRTPDAIARVSTAAQKALPDVLGPQIIADVFGLVAKATNPIADKISEAQRILSDDPETFGDSFQRISIKGQQADAAMAQAIGGNLQPLGTVVTDPEAWAGFVGNAIPSLVTAWKSGGSLPFIGWLEGMQTAQNAAEFEKKTGQKIDPVHFTQAMAQAATINAVLERFGLDQVLGAKGGGLSGVLKATLSEGSTEGLQQFNSNLAQLAAYNPQQNLSEGVLGTNSLCI